jgi:hypothetical protein
MNPETWRMIAMLAAAATLALPVHSQRRPSAHAAVFTSADGTFQFSYPSGFQVCTAGAIEPCIESYIPACERDAIVCVVYPAKKFEGTNFGAAAFEVREIHAQGEQMTPDVCVTPSPEEGFLNSAAHPEEMIGGVLFVHGVRGDVALGNLDSVDEYRAFHRQKCYELRVSQSWSNPGNYDPPIKTLTHEQQKNLDGSLSRILRSFRFLK